MPKAPHIIWPAAVVALLVLSGLTMLAVVIASRSDGGAQVVDDYYRKSVAWDSVAAERRASDALGWTVRIETPTRGRAIAAAVFTDADGNPVTGLAGSVTVSRPQSAVAYGTHSLSADDSSNGRYAFAFPYTDHGLWDLDIVAERDHDRFVERMRIEI